MELNESCPDTHYRCPGELNYCLPVYTRCNGVYDCIDREDEQGCEEVTCPGFYRCRASSVCVHVDHVCDGWPQCPQHDDEWLCEMTCPAGCLCQGLAFLCQQPFAAHLFPQLRYLDAGGSGMSPANLTYNVYLVYLSLARCSLVDVTEMNFPNLQALNLGDNELTTISMGSFVSLQNLKSLRLAQNPLSLLLEEQFTDRQCQLNVLDLSRTELEFFDSGALSPFQQIQALNISFTKIHSIGSGGFRSLPKLVELDMRGSPVKTFPSELFHGLSELRVVFSPNYRLCCEDVLPEQTDRGVCISEQDRLSSCENILRFQTHRNYFWLISVLATLGNVLCAITRHSFHKELLQNGFNVFVTNLNIANFLAGIYPGIIGVADVRFGSKYLQHENTWKSSAACKVAGFLFLLSSEVSALTIWLITLDRFIVLRFPFSSWRFQRGSAAAACLMTWLVGCALAVVPLLPVTSHWEFYGQTGICIPLPVNSQDFKGRSYSFGVQIIFNFVLLVFVAAGQTYAYTTVQRDSVTTDTVKKWEEKDFARRIINIAATDCLCWLTVSVFSLVTSILGTPVDGEVNVALAVLVLPLNSALNPFLYILNKWMEKRQKEKEARLLYLLKSRAGHRK